MPYSPSDRDDQHDERAERAEAEKQAKAGEPKAQASGNLVADLRALLAKFKAVPGTITRERQAVIDEIIARVDVAEPPTVVKAPPEPRHPQQPPPPTRSRGH